MKIAFGGTSEQKIGYLREVLKELKIDAEIEPIKIESGIAEQPLTSEETKLGSLNRAINALEKSKKADFAIGIEVGYEKNQGLFSFIFTAKISPKNSKKRIIFRRIRSGIY